MSYPAAIEDHACGEKNLVNWENVQLRPYLEKNHNFPNL